MGKGSAQSKVPQGEPAKADAAYWEGRLLRLSFTAQARPGSEEELFVRFDHEGQWKYFPLESNLASKAAARACEIYRALSDDGWNFVRRSYVRQTIWAVFWFLEPLACTYATLFTRLGRPNSANNGAAGETGRVSVALLEPEEEVRNALEHCLNNMEGYQCIRSVGRPKELFAHPRSAANTPRLVLYNQSSLDVPSFEDQLSSRWPEAVAVPFGLFGHSDELFMNIHGMDKGYFLRRRAPTQILEPLAGLWQGDRQASPAKSLRAHSQAYFQNLVLDGVHQDTAPNAAGLTQRESEILRCLGAGHTDKTISATLGISVWTVHAHVKSLFEKLGVHTRAEAVMRCMQK